MEPTARYTMDDDGIATIWLDQPEKSVVTVNPVLLDDLTQTVNRLRDEPGLKAVVVTTARPNCFVAGADLFEVRGMSPQKKEAFLAKGQTTFNLIADLNVPTVAAIGGDCLGGGLELALACDYRVAAKGKYSLGLPEVKLGILPAWGGTFRLPRLIGLSRGLPMILAGKTVTPRKAKSVGIVDEVVDGEKLLVAAKRVVIRGVKPRKLGLIDRMLASVSMLRGMMLRSARKQTLAQTFGNYPAPERVLDIVATGYREGMAAGLKAERTGLVDLSQTDAGQGLMRLFFLRQDVKKAMKEQFADQPKTIKQAAVIGGGTMGAGIAYSLIKAGIPVRLVEVNVQAAGAAMARIQGMLDDDVKAKRLDHLEARHIFNRVMPTTDWSGLKLCDIVIEAVLEKMEMKNEVFDRVEKLVRTDAILATNTSSLSVTEMAVGRAHSDRFVGLHFFNPVPKMPLVEVIKGHDTSEQTMATAVALAAKVGKSPIAVKDGPGFLVNRLLIPYLAEALTIACEMAARHEPPARYDAGIVAIDEAMKRWGMPMGPFELMDQIGLDVSVAVLNSLGSQFKQRLPQDIDMSKVLDSGWLGRKSGKGFYNYGQGKKATPTVNSAMMKLLPTEGGVGGCESLMSEVAIQWRLVLPMINECAWLLTDEIVESTDVVDLGMVMGTGLAPFRGGLVSFVDNVGVEQIVGRLEMYANELGCRFAPSPLLVELNTLRLPLSRFKEAVALRTTNGRTVANQSTPKGRFRAAP